MDSFLERDPLKDESVNGTVILNVSSMKDLKFLVI
jgi:hypothetical protein